MQRRIRRGFVGSATAFMAWLTLASTALGATYEVYSCDPNHSNGATPGWNVLVSEGLTVYGQCNGVSPEGLVARSVAGPGATSSGFQGAFAFFDAPPGTTIDSIHGYIGLKRPGCNWGAGIKATNGDFGGRWVYALEPGYCGANEISSLYWDWPIQATRVVVAVVCGAATCDRSSETRASLRAARLTINDPTPPALNSPRGALWAVDGWLAGMQDIAFEASDGAGIRRNVVQIDDQVVKSTQHACNDTQPAPCPNGGLAETIDTSKITPDGAHKLTLETVDTAGNPTQLTKTIRVDNTPPVAPTGLAVADGDGWRPSNDFSVSWSNPADDGGAPITEARFKLCRSDGSDCVEDARSSAGITSLAGLKVPARGDWALTVWLRDAAGNAGAVSAPVNLRLDDEAPSVAFEPPNPSDPTLVSAVASDGVSAVTGGRIEIRKHGSDTWKTLPSSYDGTRLTARLDDEHLPSGHYDLRAWAVDAAGNERTSTEMTSGGDAAVRLPLRVVTRIKAGVASKSARKRAKRRGTVRVPWGRKVKLGGQLLTADRNPVADSEVLVFSRLKQPGAPWVAAASLKTSRRGYFRYVAPPGASRLIRFRFAGTATVRPSVRRVRLQVRSRSTIDADHMNVLNGEYVHLKGRVLGGYIPPGGLLVEVQVRLRGTWRTFRTTHTGKAGRWKLAYRFDGTHGEAVYPLRVRIPSAPGYPFAQGRSRVLKIRVTGL